MMRSSSSFAGSAVLSHLHRGCLRLSLRNPLVEAVRRGQVLTLFFLLGASLIKAQQMAPMPLTRTTSKPELVPLAKAVELMNGVSTRPPLTLDYLLSRAFATHPALSQTRSLTTRTEALARQASLYPNPTIGYQGDQIRGGSFGGGEQGAYIAQTIPLGGKLRLRRKALEAEAASSRTSTEVQRALIRAEVSRAFYAALAAQQFVRIRRSLLLIAEDATETAHQLVNVGQADTPDLLAIEVEQDQAQLADEQAQRQYLTQFHLLALLSGEEARLPTLLQGDLAATPSSESVQVSEDNPLIHLAMDEIDAAEARLASARRDIAPDLQLKAGEQYNFEQLGYSGANRSPASKVGPQSFASAAITLPMWNRNRGNIEAAQADLESARENLRRVQLELRARAEPLLETMITAQAQAARLRESILPRATRAAQLYEQKYNQMAQAYPVVLASRRTLLNLQLRYTDTLATIWRTSVAIQNANLPWASNLIHESEERPAVAAYPTD